jgi:hypothetical protein
MIYISNSTNEMIGINLIKHVHEKNLHNTDEKSQGKPKSMERCSMYRYKKLYIVRGLVFPNFIYRCNTIPVKSQQTILWLSINLFSSLYGIAKSRKGKRILKNKMSEN